jgi:hypothetical protein
MGVVKMERISLALVFTLTLYGLMNSTNVVQGDRAPRPQMTYSFSWSDLIPPLIPSQNYGAPTERR